MNTAQLIPSISVIIPTFNGEDTLTELFASLKCQTLQPIEILVAFLPPLSAKPSNPSKFS